MKHKRPRDDDGQHSGTDPKRLEITHHDAVKSLRLEYAAALRAQDAARAKTAFYHASLVRKGYPFASSVTASGQTNPVASSQTTGRVVVQAGQNTTASYASAGKQEAVPEVKAASKPPNATASQTSQGVDKTASKASESSIPGFVESDWTAGEPKSVAARKKTAPVRLPFREVTAYNDLSANRLPDSAPPAGPGPQQCVKRDGG